MIHTTPAIAIHVDKNGNPTELIRVEYGGELGSEMRVQTSVAQMGYKIGIVWTDTPPGLRASVSAPVIVPPASLDGYDVSWAVLVAFLGVSFLSFMFGHRPKFKRKRSENL